MGNGCRCDGRIAVTYWMLRPTVGAGHWRLVVARYVVERTFCDGLDIPANGEGRRVCLGVVKCNAELGVTWVHSYVSEDRTKTFCVYDGPDPEAIRAAAQVNGLPVDAITRVTVLDPYFYQLC
jgi:hypothetical protein